MFQAEHDHSWDLVDHLEEEDLPGWAIALIVIGNNFEVNIRDGE
jgi:hypothetical protein